MQFFATITAVFFVLCLSVSTSAQEAEIGLYYQGLHEEGEITHRAFLEGFSYLGERGGVWGVGYAEQGYASIVAGPYWDFLTFGEDSVVELGVAAGAEALWDEEECTCEYSSRYASFLFVGNERLFADLYYENGESEEAWKRGIVHWQTTKRLAFGVIHQTGDGTGPRVLFNAFEPVRIWAAPMFGEDERKFLFGVDIIFTKQKK